MSEKLEPCPWCGADALLLGMKSERYVECSRRCPASWDSLVTATEWNTRPIESALRAENATLRARVAELEAEVNRAWEDAMGDDL